MNILRVRLKPLFGSTTEYVTVASKMKSLIENEHHINETFNLVVDEKGKKYAIEYGPDNIDPSLVNKELPISNSKLSIKFIDDGTLEVIRS